jgi:hypothetical protein
MFKPEIRDNALKVWLLRPMSHYNIPMQRGIQALLFGFFVFAFLYFFQPFQLDQTGSRMLSICVGFGLVTTVAMLVLNVLVPVLFAAFFQENAWKVWKELSWTLINLSFIGLANFLYFSWLQEQPFRLDGILWFQVATWAVGVFPVSIFILIREQRARTRYQTLSSGLSYQLRQKKDRTSKQDEYIKLVAQNQSDALQMHSDQLQYIMASENYIVVYYFEKDCLQKKLLRMTLKSAEEVLAGIPTFFRCHKSYLVNLNRVSDISGNAQGYKLHLEHCPEPVPVSRQYNAEIKNRLSVRP